jgi:hypothetical protein
LAEAPGRERWVLVEIQGRYLEFRYRVVPMRDGAVVGEPGEWVECACSNDDLLVRIDEGIAAALERLQEPIASHGGTEPSNHQDHPPDHPPVEVAYRKLTGLGRAGIVVGALGLSGVAVGGVFLGLGERVPEDRLHLERDYRPPGVAVLVSGGVLLAAGVSMFVVDLVQCRNEHPRCVVQGGGGGATSASRRRSVVLGPWLGGRVVGLAGRF